MEKVNARRGFLKGFGLGAAVVGGFASVGAANAVSMVGSSVPDSVTKPESINTVEDISHLSPKDNATSLVITGDNRPPPPPAPVPVCNNPYVINGSNGLASTSNGLASGQLFVGNYYQSCPPEELNKVSMAVGKDDRLWIRVGDSWKRVALEN